MTVTPEQFLAAILPAQGPYIFSRPSKDANGETSYRATHFDTIEAALAWSREQAERGANVYFTPAAFRDRGSRRRKHNVRALRDLFVDIDTLETKKEPVLDQRLDPAQAAVRYEAAMAEYRTIYPTRSAALEALGEVVAALDLPDPWIVSSGGGLHVHWALNEDLELHDWLPLANRLRDRLVEAGLRFDAALTVNPTCLLRPPGTKNHKPSLPKPRMVQVMNTEAPEPVPVVWLKNHLAAVAGPTSTDPLAVVPEGFEIDESMLMQMLQRDPVSSAEIFEHCQAMRWCRDNPAAVREPLWFAGLRVLKFCTDGAEAMQSFSQGHPDYDSEVVESYADRIERPGSCKAIRMERPDGCKGCPGEFLGSSPAFAKRWTVQPIVAAAAAPGKVMMEVEQLKAGEWEDGRYERRLGHWYRKAFKDASGATVPEARVMRASLMPLGLLESRADGSMQSAVLLRDIHPINGLVHFDVPADTIFSRPKEFQGLLANRHHLLDGKELGGAQTMMQHWQRRLLEQSRISYVSTRLGWDGDRGGDQVRWHDTAQAKVFRMPEYTINRDRVQESIFRPKATALQPEVFRGMGTLADWLGVYQDFVGADKRLLGLLTLTAFASPLMSLMGSEAAIVVASDPLGGTGKTAAVRMGASVFSHPGDSRGIVLGGNVTTHAIGVHCATLGDLPAYINELDLSARHTGVQSMAATIYSIVNGSGMTRGRSDGTTVTMEAWNLLLTITTNANLIGELIAMKGTSQARLQRLLVVTPKRSLALQGGVAVRNEKMLAANHGVAGRLYLEHLVKNQHRLSGAAAAALEFTGDLFGFAKYPEERIRWHTVAALVLGYQIASRLGICPLVEADVLGALEQVVNENRMETAAAAELKSATTAVSDFMNEHIRSIIRYKAKGTQLVDNLNVLVEPLMGRYDLDSETLILTDHAMRKMSMNLGLSNATFIEQLKMSGYNKPVKRSTFTLKGGKPTITAKGYLFDYALLDAVIGGGRNLKGEPSNPATVG